MIFVPPHAFSLMSASRFVRFVSSFARSHGCMLLSSGSSASSRNSQLVVVAIRLKIRSAFSDRAFRTSFFKTLSDKRSLNSVLYCSNSADPEKPFRFQIYLKTILTVGIVASITARSTWWRWAALTSHGKTGIRPGTINRVKDEPFGEEIK